MTRYGEPNDRSATGDCDGRAGWAGFTALCRWQDFLAGIYFILSRIVAGGAGDAGSVIFTKSELLVVFRIAPFAEIE